MLPLIVAFSFAFVLVIIVAILVMRSQREKHRVELQKAILERVGSVKDFAEFLTTEQGERFLASLAPAQFSTHHRTLWSVRVGVVLFTIGVFLMVMLHTLPLRGDEPRTLLLGTLLLIGAGLGMLLSSAVAFLIGRALGVNGPNSRKDGAA
jgi:hypothetical protein